MKIAICSLNSKYIHSSLAPWCLLAGVREYSNFLDNPSNSISIMEGTINEEPSSVLARILKCQPSAVAFSCYIWNISAVYNMIELLKKELPSCIVILGGPEVSYNTSEIMAENSNIDYIISGEGERPFSKLCTLLSDGIVSNSFSDLGIATRSSPCTVHCTPSEIPPSPYGSEYFENLNSRIAYLETSRGCPYRCAFCLSGRCGGVRFYPVSRAKSEMLLLAKSGTQTVKLVDRTFNAEPKRAYELFSFVIENYGTEIPKGVCFHFEIAGDILDDKTISLLQSAPIGAIQLEIGLQSFNELTLSKVNRKTSIEKLVHNIQALLKNDNIHIHIDLIAGLPDEDIESFVCGFNLACALRPHMLQLGFLKLLHGADMREKRNEYPCEYSKEPPYEVTKTPWLSSDDIKILKLLEDVVERFYNSGRFKRTFDYVMSSLFTMTPFDVLLEFAEYLQENETSKSLDDFTDNIYRFFSNSDADTLRDKLVEDRLLTNSSGKIPESLRIEDERLRLARISLEHDPKTKCEKGIKRAVALLYTENKVMCVDYKEKNPVNGEYMPVYYDMDERCQICRY